MGVLIRDTVAGEIAAESWSRKKLYWINVSEGKAWTE